MIEEVVQTLADIAWIFIGAAVLLVLVALAASIAQELWEWWDES